MNKLHFEFRRRLPADVVYRYESVDDPKEKLWKRTDMDLWVKFMPKIGWAGVNASNEVFSIPWIIPAADQGELPPEGKWVSCKNDKSYVYDLVFDELPGNRQDSRRQLLGFAGCVSGSDSDLTVEQLREEHLKKYE